jgi:hypothetical protein
MGLCKRANVIIPNEVHYSITSTINDYFVNRFCQAPLDKAEGAGTSSSRPKPRRALAFDQMAFASYCCENFEASRRSQTFLFDAMQQQFQNTFLAPEDRTFPTQAEYVSYANWPEGRPNFMGVLAAVVRLVVYRWMKRWRKPLVQWVAVMMRKVKRRPVGSNRFILVFSFFFIVNCTLGGSSSPFKLFC